MFSRLVRIGGLGGGGARRLLAPPAFPSRNMCGIVAVIDQGLPPVEANVREVCSRMHMRGPDGQGYVAGSTSAFHWALAHQRLSIMDPSAAGDQVSDLGLCGTTP